jgi:hypothetical protein
MASKAGTKKSGARAGKAKAAEPASLPDQTRGGTDAKNPLVATLRHLVKYHGRKKLVDAFKELEG